MKSHHDKVRACLADSSDGLSIAEIAKCTQIEADSLRQSIKTCFGVYVDRYEGPIRGQWQAIYMLAEVPEDVPMPDRKKLT